MFDKFKKLVKRYDDWCKRMGLLPEQKRCCVPITKQDVFSNEEKKDE